MAKFDDLTGRRFERLIATRLLRYDQRSHSTIWECICDCKTTCEIRGNYLRSGHTQSCGCFNDEKLGERSTKHGERRSSEYGIWAAMKGRCSNSKNSDYQLYGGRGITVCERWRESFENFLADMGRKPSKRHSLD